MIRSLYALQSVKTGFDSHNVVTMVVSVAGINEEGPGGRRIFYPALLERVKALPGIQAAGAINYLPLAGDLWDRNLWIDGRPKPKPGEALNAVYRIAMPGYFDAMQLPIVMGRAITSSDDRRSPAVVMINRQAAEKFWARREPDWETDAVFAWQRGWQSQLADRDRSSRKCAIG